MKLPRLLQSDYLLLALFTIPAILPLVLNAGLPNTADGALHVYRTFELDRAWHDGVAYPRIAPDFAYGYGYAIFNYYAPLFYWLGNILHTNNLNFEHAVKAAIIVIFYLYPLGMYLLVRDLTSFHASRLSDLEQSRKAALVSGIAYLYAPYHFYEAFIQGDYPQFLALAIVPFCLWAATPLSLSERGVGGEGQFRFFSFILAYAALVLAHNITALIATPLIGAYMLFILFSLSLERNPQVASRKSQFINHFTFHASRLTLAIALSVALTAFFWLPALGEQRYVRIERLTQGFFHFENYFLTAREILSPNVPPDLAGVNPYIPFNLGPSLLIIATLGFIAALTRRVGRHATWTSLAPYIFFVGLTLAMAAMTLPISTPLWEHLPLLPLTEFPWRFIGLAAIPLAMLVGLATQEIKNWWLDVRSWKLPNAEAPPRYLHSLIFSFLSAFIILDNFVYLFPRTPFLPYGTPTLRDIAEFEMNTQALGTTSAGEYLPLWTQRRMYDSPLMESLRANRIPRYLDRAALPAAVSAQMLEQNVIHETHRVTSTASFLLHTRRIYFPGWTATIDGQPAPLDLAAPYGTMRVNVPAGSHTVTFAFGQTRLRQLADGISLIALVSGIAIAVWQWRRRRETQFVLETNPSLFPYPLHGIALALIVFYFIAPSLGFVRVSPLPHVIGAQQPRNDHLGDEFRLLGYDVSPSSLTAGESLTLAFYWQPLRVITKDYAVFVQLAHPQTLIPIAETKRAHPGNILTIDLPLSLYVRDTHVLTTTPNIEPGVYWLRVGMVDTRSNQSLQVTQPDGARRGAVNLQTVRVRRATPVDLNGVTRTQARFGEVELVGYKLVANLLTLYWRAARTPQNDATVFVHLLNDDQQLVATFDSPPTNGLLPMRAWSKDELIADHRLITPKTSGTFRLAIGLYDPQTLQRYPATLNGQRLPNDAYVLERTLEVKP
jgi:hypothetical protein